MFNFPSHVTCCLAPWSSSQTFLANSNRFRDPHGHSGPGAGCQVWRRKDSFSLKVKYVTSSKYFQEVSLPVRLCERKTWHFWQPAHGIIVYNFGSWEWICRENLYLIWRRRNNFWIFATIKICHNMCSKNFENRLTNKYFMPKLYFVQGFCISKGDNPWVMATLLTLLRSFDRL